MWQYRPRQPAVSYGEVMQTTHKRVGHGTPIFENFQQVISTGFNQLHVSQQILRAAIGNTAAVSLCLGFAATAKCVDHVLPGASQKFWVLGCEIGFCQ